MFPVYVLPISPAVHNPEYFASLLDQGMLPLDVMKEQLRTFSEQILREVGN